MQAKLTLLGTVLTGVVLAAGCSSSNNSSAARSTATVPAVASVTTPASSASPAVTAASSVAAAGGTVVAGAATPPLRSQDRDQIQQVVQDYLAALLQQRDQTQLRQYLRTGVPDQQIQRARDQLRTHDYHLVAITDITVSGDKATATVRLQDRDGTEITRTLQLERDQDQWRISDPTLGGS